MLSYEQACRLFALWLEESEGVKHVEEVKEIHVRRYIIELQSRGKYTFTSNIRSRDINHPDRRTDYGHKITNITINNYLRNIRVFFAWLVDIECIPKSTMAKIRELPEQRSSKEYISASESKARWSSMRVTPCRCGVWALRMTSRLQSEHMTRSDRPYMTCVRTFRSFIRPI